MDEVKYDMENFANPSVRYAPHRHRFSNSYESWLKPLVFIIISFFLSICFKLENMLTSIYVKLPPSSEQLSVFWQL